MVYLAKIPQKPGTEDSALTAIELLEKMGDKLPEKAKAKLAARTKELEAVELEKIKAKEAETVKSGEAPKTEKKGIPAHILAKIKAKQAARAEEVAESKASHTGSCKLFRQKIKIEFRWNKLAATNAFGSINYALLLCDWEKVVFSVWYCL